MPLQPSFRGLFAPHKSCLPQQGDQFVGGLEVGSSLPLSCDLVANLSGEDDKGSAENERDSFSLEGTKPGRTSPRTYWT
jgi:hypothetical protein